MMLPDRWTLEKWAKYFVLTAYVFFLLAKILERAELNARRAAEGEVHRHEWDEHEVGR